MLPDTTVVMTFIVVHMKAFSDATSYERRVEAASRLKNHIDFTSLSSRPVVLLGDYNDLLESSITSGRTSPYAPFLEDDTDYRALTLEIERSGEGSFCSNLNCSARGSLIDHITITNELFDWYSEGSTRVLTTLPGAIVLYGGSTSDHLPVMASFRRPSTTSIADERPVGAFLLGAPFPNPTADRVFLPLHLNAPAPVRLALYDVLGREVEVLVDGMLPAGTHHVPVFLDRRPAGTYVVRGSDGQARRIVRVR